jgi:hypothetical protein
VVSFSFFFFEKTTLVHLIEMNNLNTKFGLGQEEQTPSRPGKADYIEPVVLVSEQLYFLRGLHA